MLRFTPVALLLVLLVACRHEGITSSAKDAEFDRRCVTDASERIADNSADGAVNLSLDNTMAFEVPVGTAKLPALDGEYHPSHLASTLLTGPDKLDEVRVSYGRSCPKAGGGETLMARLSAPMEASIPACTDGKPRSVDDLARYSIVYEYGEVDRFDIRPFAFKLVDRTNGRILAQQRSFQLLLGGMHDRDGRLACYGGCQNTRTCPLTPPDQVVKRVFRPECPRASPN